jgi:hypothetical protein
MRERHQGIALIEFEHFQNSYFIRQKAVPVANLLREGIQKNEKSTGKYCHVLKRHRKAMTKNPIAITCVTLINTKVVIGPVPLTFI